MSADLPLVSVIVPARNEGRAIGECLAAILRQDYPPDCYEVLVVDGESEDDSRQVVQRVAAGDARVRLLGNPERIVPCAMNIGIRAARGEVIARVDGHTRIAPDYLRIGVGTLRRTGADNVGGAITPIGSGVFGDAIASAMCSRLGIGASFHFITSERQADTVYMGMWPRRAFERFGLFDEELVRNQDDELNYRIRKTGGKVWLNPRMRSSYQNRQTVEGLARQFFQYGEWKVRVLQKHPRQMSWRHFVPPCLILVLLVGWALALRFEALAAPVAGLFGLYMAGVAVVSALQPAARSPAGWFATAAAFVIIHMAWGTGFLVGLVRFAGRWRRLETPPPRLPVTAGELPGQAGH